MVEPAAAQDYVAGQRRRGQRILSSSPSLPSPSPLHRILLAPSTSLLPIPHARTTSAVFHPPPLSSQALLISVSRPSFFAQPCRNGLASALARSSSKQERRAHRVSLATPLPLPPHSLLTHLAMLLPDLSRAQVKAPLKLDYPSNGLAPDQRGLLVRCQR